MSHLVDHHNDMGDFQVDYGQTLFMCILYLSIGSVSIFCSLTTITLYLTNRDLRRKYILYLVLDCCELLDAISYVLLGTGRGHELLTGVMAVPITVRACFFTKYWPQSLILGTQLPSICTLFLSFERILAVVRPAVYKRMCTQNFKYCFVAMVPVWAVLTLVAAGVSVIGEDGDRVVGTRHCAIITSTSRWYATFHFIFIVLTYVIAFFSTLVVWATRRVMTTLTKSKYGSQDDKLGMILAMSGTSIILLASPAVVMLTIRWDITGWGDIEVAITYAMPGFLSVVNTIISFRFRKELRSQFYNLIGKQVKSHKPEQSMFTRTTMTTRRTTMIHHLS
ncbi:G-protein coupled receptors family 1 profile domain-containing protein [Caenorhabditis elegans]|uniref:G-protein coupled receptors family 1 profile domain-containing protein n=1 Tax=Caenorhabditis elegans TaxID=6239 RepID=Q21638_CAEEL|nr:G-protein coupled receptors family 1 profile domain-containing protein [Caenorhabditis elegans]CAB01435.3 G-protein coupled receptors family 1 profile domain-containing protein [Caenorhabditis elegans]|eukprot:NP_001256589.1 Serpentine receptor class gamma [Caenorhabditis elegans]